MCGINGIFSKQKIDLLAYGNRMNALIQHRGPDDEGSVLFNNDQAFPLKTFKSVNAAKEVSYLNYTPVSEVNNAFGWLGHRRLSIIDLSDLGHEPMADETGRYWLTFNGEIYNYLELRMLLQKEGVKFKTNTDAEVLLKAYIFWGEQCLARFNGMWAFSIYDVKKQQLFAARDRVGVKPFYFTKSNQVFSFSSEQKAIVMSGIWKKKINKAAAYDYLAYANIELQREGLFEGVQELLPGEQLVFNFKKWELSINAYFDLAISDQNTNIDNALETEYIDNIKSKFETAVNLRLRSDVTVGACLSGGIDSSAIVGQMFALSNNTIHTFTASADDAVFDETHFAQKVIAQTNASSNFVTPTAGELVRDLDELVYAQDIPLFSTSTYAQFRVMRLAKEQGVKVVLDGQGGDELFGGYLPYHINLWLDDLKRLNVAALNKELKAFGSLSGGVQFFIKQYLKHYGLNKTPKFLLKKITQKLHKEHSYLASGFKNDYEYAALKKQQAPPKSLNGVLKHEYINTRLKGYLKCEDRCSMWHGVEARVPFADDLPLMEYVFQIPGNYKIQNGIKKHLLKEATKHLLPADIYNRKDKMGYVTPNNRWVFESKDAFKKYFTSDLEEYFNYELLMKDYDSFFDQRHLPENQKMFKFIAFAAWKKAYGL